MNEPAGPAPRAAAEVTRVGAEERDRMLARIAEVTPHFIFIYDYELGRDAYINRSAPAALGYTAEQEAAMGSYPFARLCHPEDFARAMDRDRRWGDVADGVVDTVEFRLRDASGRWRWFRSLNTPFRRDANGRVTQFLGVSEDVTDRRRVEETLRRSERLDSLAVLAGGLAHDFGNLLTPVLGRAELLAAALPVASPLREHAEAIRAAAEHAAELVEQLTLYAGRRPRASAPVRLDRLVREVLELLRPVQPHGIVLDLALDAAAPAASGDASQLRQVLLNLLTNAFEAVAGNGGRVTVSTRGCRLAPAEIARLDLADHVAPGAAVLLEVADDGVGMDAETRSRLWEPFYTTKPRGRGLGLASVLGILRRHHAGLAVESQPRGGTVFRVFLPAADAAADAAPAR